MNLAELKFALDTAGVSERAYSLATPDPSEVYRIGPIHDHLGDGWEVYYSERGNKNDLLIFRSESEACADLLRRVLRDPTTRTAAHLRGQQAARAEPPMLPRGKDTRARIRNSPETLHIPLVTAVVILLANLYMTTHFLIATQAIMHLQQSKTVQLPVASDARRIDFSNDFKVVLKADEIVYVNDQPETDAAVLDEIRKRKVERIRIVADRRVRYDRLKQLIVKLGTVSGLRVTFSVADDTSKPARPETPNPATSAPKPEAH